MARFTPLPSKPLLIMWKVVSFFCLAGKGFNSDNFSFAFEAKFPQVTFVENPPMKIYSYHKLKHGYLIYS